VGVWQLAAAHPVGAADGTAVRGMTTVGVAHERRTVRGEKMGAASLTMWTVADACVGMRGGLAPADGWLAAAPAHCVHGRRREGGGAERGAAPLPVRGRHRSPLLFLGHG